MKGATVHYLYGQKFKLTHEKLGDQFPRFGSASEKWWFVWHYYPATSKFEYIGHFSRKGLAESWMRDRALKCRQ